MIDFFEQARMQNHPMRFLLEFLEKEKKNEQAANYEHLRFVGYVLDIGYDTITVITSDPFKINVGGLPRNSFLIMVPNGFGDTIPPHFTLLRVLDVAPTPLDKQVQQTFFELQKKSMPELDVFTQSELQWGALRTSVLGMFYPHPADKNKVEFAADMNNFVSAHKYRVYAPDKNLLDLIINTLVPEDNRFAIGELRLTENRLKSSKTPEVDVHVSPRDFMGTRTALFGKTRLGKSNIIKLIAQSIIVTTKENKNVGQLIFDADGEYANDNPQDDSRSIRSGYTDDCIVFAHTQKPQTPSELIRSNFYEFPSDSLMILSTLLSGDDRGSIYIRAFMDANVPPMENQARDSPLAFNEKIREKRRILMYWSILKKAGFEVDENTLKRNLRAKLGVGFSFDPRYKKELREALYSPNIPPVINSLDSLVTEFEKLADFNRRNPDDPNLISSSGNPLIDPDDQALLNFLKPRTGAGPTVLAPYKKFHHPEAGKFVEKIIEYIDGGKTVILDLGNANPEVARFYSNLLTEEIFYHQVDKFTNNELGNHFVQLYFEEAHNLFPEAERAGSVGIYRRIAKEGAKFHIGMVYSTQSPTTINRDLMAQTENFFIAHMSSRSEVDYLAKVNVAYESLKEDILKTKTPGYVRMLTRSNRFVVPVQAMKFTPPGVN